MQNENNWIWRRGIAGMAFLVLTLGGLVSAEEVTLRQQVDLLEEKSGASDVVVTVAAKATLQVLTHEDKWVRVRTADGKEGYVSAAILSSDAARDMSFFDRTLQKIGAGPTTAPAGSDPQASNMSSGAAAKGFDVEDYAKEKKLSKDGLNAMLRFRNAVKGADWKKFASDGNVGPDHS